MQPESTRPPAGWVLTRRVPGAPHSFTRSRHGTVHGWWTTHGVKHGVALTDGQLRAYGYEICCCATRSGSVDPYCVAHATAGSNTR